MWRVVHFYYTLNLFKLFFLLLFLIKNVILFIFLLNYNFTLINFKNSQAAIRKNCFRSLSDFVYTIFGVYLNFEVVVVDLFLCILDCISFYFGLGTTFFVLEFKEWFFFCLLNVFFDLFVLLIFEIYAISESVYNTNFISVIRLTFTGDVVPPIFKQS